MWVGFLLAALLINGLTLLEASDALGEALRDREAPSEPEVTQFEMVDVPEEERPTFVDPDVMDGRTPEHSNHLAEADSNPEHETRTANRPSSAASQAQPQPQPQPQPRPDVADATEQGGAPELHDAADGQQSDDAATKPGPPQLATLGGSRGALQAALGEHGTHDDLRDIDEGETNVLKTKRNLYASFFNRLRDRVAEHWEPERANKAADPQQKKFGTATRTTVLWVQLDAEGAVTKIVVKRESGAEHLDQEAIRALKAASPFPNPPDDLIDGDGNIEFDFGFTLDFVEGGRIFRYQR